MSNAWDAKMLYKLKVRKHFLSHDKPPNPLTSNTPKVRIGVAKMIDEHD